MLNPNRQSVVKLAVVLIAILVLLPLLSGTGVVPFCGKSTSAQDNPCLAQEATISALKGALLQATIDGLNHQATIVAFQPAGNGAGGTAGGTVVTAVPTKPPGVLFTETFDNNNKGWDLRGGKWGSGSLSRGQLLLQAENDYLVDIWLPDFESSNFYVQTEVTTEFIFNIGIGYVIGNSETGKKHFFALNERYSSVYVSLMDISNDWATLLSTEYGQPGELWKENTKFSLGLEAKNGLYTLYVNGQPTESVQFRPEGSNLGVAVHSNSGKKSAFFDNIVVRQGR
ncbi:MAG: hypothetical protein IAE83_09500 [Anaerolinea sp.]|nr:hypothetical protein [Anaerolinea sp.]